MENKSPGDGRDPRHVYRGDRDRVSLVAMARRLTARTRAALDRHWRGVFFACFVILVVAISATQIEQYHITKDGQREGAERRAAIERVIRSIKVQARDSYVTACENGWKKNRDALRAVIDDTADFIDHAATDTRSGQFTAKLRQIVEDKAPKVNCKYPPPSVSTTTTTTEKP
jgi:hypothetical protein